MKHSYCPNCNHKLGFFDLFPVFSYILLKGKCKYCNNKIRPRYLILEISSGIAFLILAISAKINVFNIYSIIHIIFLLLYVSILFIIAGIDKENIKIEKSVLIFGYIMEILYIIYQYTFERINVYQYVIYASLFIILLFISNISNSKYGKELYIIQNLYLSLYILIGYGSIIYILTLILTLIVILIYKVLKKQTHIPIGFYLCINNIIVVAITNIITNYII